MNDREFMSWLAYRLVEVYGESPNVDFVLRLRRMAAQQTAFLTRSAPLGFLRPAVDEDVTPDVAMRRGRRGI